jgi:hypothetical protein
MLAWIGEFGELARIGIEGTGSYGAGLTRHVAKAGVTVLEAGLARTAAARARMTTSPRSAPPAPRCSSGAPSPRNPKTAPWSRCGCCESPGRTRPGSGAARCSCCG